MATLTTPVMGLPYPDGTERVMDGDNAMGALAAAIDGPLGRLNYPQGCVLQGTGYVLSATPQKVPVSSFLSGNGSFWDNNNSRLVVPAGMDGLYLFWCYALGQPAAVNQLAQVSVRLAESTVQGAANFPTNIATTVAANVLGFVQLAAGNHLTVWGSCTAGQWPTITVQRFGIVRLGASIPASLLRDIEASQPAPDPGDA